MGSYILHYVMISIKKIGKIQTWKIVWNYHSGNAVIYLSGGYYNGEYMGSNLQ